MVHGVYIFVYGSDKVKSADMLSYHFCSHCVALVIIFLFF
jgi:hypothetical protein